MLSRVGLQRSALNIQARCLRFKIFLATMHGRSVTKTPTVATLTNYFVWFVKWLYTAKIDESEDLCFFKMTYLGYKLGAPEFQNAALEMLAEENEVEWIPYWFGPYDIITKCWNETDFSEDLKLGYCLERGEVYWKYKEFLLFMLDCAVWQGERRR